MMRANDKEHRPRPRGERGRAARVEPGEFGPQIVAYVETWCKQRQLRLTDLVSAGGVHASWFSKWRGSDTRSPTNPRLDSLVELCHAMEMPLGWLLVNAGIVDLPFGGIAGLRDEDIPGYSSVEQALATDITLTEDGRANLVAILNVPSNRTADFLERRGQS